jgi:hypothetical protein
MLTEADLSSTKLAYTNFTDSILIGAKLNWAHLGRTDFTGTDLTDADLTNSFMYRAIFSGKLSGADFTGATIALCYFNLLDLSNVKGLDAVKFMGPSAIDIQALYRSNGKISEAFLRGCGIPESFITQIPALIASVEPIQFYSCFISYSSKDQEFTDRLYADLQNAGVRCWFAPEDLKIGDEFRNKIDESIRLHDKLLLVLSENSVTSPWVRDEVEAAFERERKENRIVLFPIQIDNSINDITTGWAAAIRRTRHIGDFRNWKNYDAYRKSFDRLMRDLKAGINRETARGEAEFQRSA